MRVLGENRAVSVTLNIVQSCNVRHFDVCSRPLPLDVTLPTKKYSAFDDCSSTEDDDTQSGQSGYSSAVGVQLRRIFFYDNRFWFLCCEYFDVLLSHVVVLTNSHLDVYRVNNDRHVGTGNCERTPGFGSKLCDFKTHSKLSAKMSRVKRIESVFDR